MEAEASLVAHSWGTETGLMASGLEDDQTYRVFLLHEDGAPVSSGTFYGTGDRPVERSSNAALDREEAAGPEVRSADGELVLGTDLPQNPRRGARSFGATPRC